MSSAAMFTAVTGATAQQIRIDVIANNLANLGTVGFKRMRAQFEDLLYETVRQPAAEGDSPTGLQFGRGVRVVATEQVDTVFDSIHLAGKLDTPGMGFMYVTPLEKAATYIPPQVVEKLKDKG